MSRADDTVNSGFDRTRMWAAHFAVLRELLEHMTPLYKVLQYAHWNNSQCSYMVAVPPDEAIPNWAVKNGRVSQDYVRSHIFRHRSNRIFSLVENASATLNMGPQPYMSQCPGSDSEEEQQLLFGETASNALQHESDARLYTANSFGNDSLFLVTDLSTLRTAPAKGTLTLTTPWAQGGKTVQVYGIDQVRNAITGVRPACGVQPFLTLVFIDGSLYCEFDWESVRMQNDGGEVRPGAMSSGQHAAAAALRVAITGSTAVQQHNPAPADRDPDVEGSPLLNRTNPLHSWIMRLYNQIAFATIRGESVTATPDRAAQTVALPHHGVTSDASVDNDMAKSVLVFEVAPMFRALLTIINEDVCNVVLLRLDTELVVFDSTYVCVPGFEQFTVAKINKIIESLAADFVDAVKQDCNNRKKRVNETLDTVTGVPKRNSEHNHDTPTRMGASGTAARSTSLHPAFDVSPEEHASIMDGISDFDVDVIVTALHTIFTAGVVPVILPHWRAVHNDADQRFFLQAGALRDSATAADLGIPAMPTDALNPAIRLVAEFDKSYSVFTFMRIAERIFAVLGHVTDLWNIRMTPDASIPLLLFILSRARPRYLMSTIQFVSSFSLQVLDMSALGYSFTSIEAAAHQLAREYNDRVVLRNVVGSSSN